MKARLGALLQALAITAGLAWSCMAAAQQEFPTPEKAVQAFVKALGTTQADHERLNELLGKEWRNYIPRAGAERKDVDAFLKQYHEQNKIEKTNIFGYSMGGYVALYFAKNSPESVDKIFTLATKWNWTIAGATQETKMLNPTIIKEKVPKYAHSLEQLHGDSWETVMEKTAKMMLQLGANPTFQKDDFIEITTPTLLSVGDKDAMVSIEETVDVYRALPNAQLLVLPNTSHPIDRVDVEELAHQISKFLL